MIVVGGASIVPVICGENTGQHIYVDFNGNSTITISISTSGSATVSRAWNIRISQINCNCPYKGKISTYKTRLTLKLSSSKKIVHFFRWAYLPVLGSCSITPHLSSTHKPTRPSSFHITKSRELFSQSIRNIHNRNYSVMQEVMQYAVADFLE